MKRIGILTQYYKSKNIGGLLQSYALPVILCRLRYSAQQIAFDYNYIDQKAKKLAWLLRKERFSIKKFFYKALNLFKRMISPSARASIEKQLLEQNKFFSTFEESIEHFPLQYNCSTITQVNKEFDVFVSGSDQVFSSYLLPFSAYYGEFALHNKKVISYAASAGANRFPPLAEKLFIKKLARLNAISVREKTLKDYIERITDKKATVVLDPTFLLSPQEWLKIANPAPVPQKPYIFCYFLGGKSAWQRKIAQAYADKYGYEVIHLPYIMRSVRPADRFLKGQGRYDVGPREFIALINEAQCVFTDSFHGLAFSINFGKNFYVFDRDDKSGPDSMNARITDTLDTFGLAQRHITGKNAVLDNASLDFTYAHKVLAREKERSINWLLNALKD